MTSITFLRKCAAGCGGYSGKNKFCSTKRCVESRKFCYDCGVNERDGRAYRCRPCHELHTREVRAAAEAKARYARETGEAIASRGGAVSQPARPSRPVPALSPAQQKCPHCGGFRIWDPLDADIKCLNCGRRAGLRLAG